VAARRDRELVRCESQGEAEPIVLLRVWGDDRLLVGPGARRVRRERVDGAGVVSFGEIVAQGRDSQHVLVHGDVRGAEDVAGFAVGCGQFGALRPVARGCAFEHVGGAAAPPERVIVASAGEQGVLMQVDVASEPGVSGFVIGDQRLLVLELAGFVPLEGVHGPSLRPVGGGVAVGAHGERVVVQGRARAKKVVLATRSGQRLDVLPTIWLLLVDADLLNARGTKREGPVVEGDCLAVGGVVEEMGAGPCLIHVGVDVRLTEGEDGCLIPVQGKPVPELLSQARIFGGETLIGERAEHRWLGGGRGGRGERDGKQGQGGQQGNEPCPHRGCLATSLGCAIGWASMLACLGVWWRWGGLITNRSP
jgi:hypothetical protein